MNFTLSPEQTAMREEIVAFARAELNDGAGERDREQRFDRMLWEKCGARRLPGLLVPEAYGGFGADALDAAIALEALGYGCRDGGLVFSLAAHLLACGVPILKHGTEEQKERFLPGLSDGSLIAANAITEPESGSDVFAMHTVATPADDGFAITGTKAFISNAPVADLLLVYAKTDTGGGFHGGITAFLVEKATPGLSVSGPIDKLGLRSCAMGEIVLDNVFVQGSGILGPVGKGGVIFAQSMDWERACLGAAHVGAIERLLDDAIAFARTRKSGGKAIGARQAVAHRLADMKVNLEAARLLTHKACSELESDRRSGLSAAISKLFVSEAFVDAATDAIRTLGGRGYLAEHEAERTLRDAVGGTIYSGTSDVQRNIIARWLGLPGE